jgi:hypothetical protein
VPPAGAGTLLLRCGRFRSRALTRRTVRAAGHAGDAREILLRGGWCSPSAFCCSQTSSTLKTSRRKNDSELNHSSLGVTPHGGDSAGGSDRIRASPPRLRLSLCTRGPVSVRNQNREHGCVPARAIPGTSWNALSGSLALQCPKFRHTTRLSNACAGLYLQPTAADRLGAGPAPNSNTRIGGQIEFFAL